MADLGNLLAGVDCDVRVDTLTRHLYSTDASLYSVRPQGVAFPQNPRQAGDVIRAAANAGISVTPRGSGSGLVGGAIGDGLIVDFSRFNRQITDLDLEKRSVRTGAGVVLDQLNAFLRPHGFCFGPDVATSSRASLGGMISNNSSGARTPYYGTTSDHVIAVDLVMGDGRIETTGPSGSGLKAEAEAVERITRECAGEIRQRMPADLLKRWPGYGLDGYLQDRNLAQILAGSEGTLAAITSATLKIVPIPKQKGLGLIFFASVAEAMQATVELLDLKPVAIEHIDRVLTDQTKGQLQFQAARDLLELDTRPAESILLVEFYDDIADRLAALERRPLGLRRRILRSSAEMNLVWALRKAGVALLTGCKGRSKPATCIEDTAVRPAQLPEYVAALQSIMKPLQVEACFYGHAASGLLHVRPVLDLHNPDGLRKLRLISDEVAKTVRHFQGSLAAEHGVGMARTEYMREQLGTALLGGMHAIKQVFDPRNIFNPGKIFDDGRYRIDTRLRSVVAEDLVLPFEPVLAFARKDESFLGNLEQCNGCGGCRKASPTMCPTFLVTGEEIMSTRGRANVIRGALENRFGTALESAELKEALSDCLSCKACTTECPSNVNMALLKAELQHARIRLHGLTLRERMLSSVDRLGRIATVFPSLANLALQSKPGHALVARMLGFTTKRPLPAYAGERFDTWFDARVEKKPWPRGKVMLWDDCFVRYHEPEIGQAAVKVLTSAGFEVTRPARRECCGRPAFSQGNLTEARRLAAYNVTLLAADTTPIVFLEPSCFSMLAEDYRELGFDRDGQLAKRSFLFEQFVDDLLRRNPDALSFSERTEPVAIHAHCHAKSLTNPRYMTQLAQRLPGRTAILLETGCCGMAGAFGMIEEKYDLSMKVAEPLVDQIRAQPPGTMIVASGTSCRQQISHAASCQALHMAVLLARALRQRE